MKTNTQTPSANSPATRAAAEARHTPTPWKLHEVLASEPDQTGVLNIRSGDVNVLGLTTRHGRRDAADAAFIVEAVNSHAALVARIAELEEQQGCALAALEETRKVLRQRSCDASLRAVCETALAAGYEAAEARAALAKGVQS
jgi:hypothetical protein